MKKSLFLLLCFTGIVHFAIAQVSCHSEDDVKASLENAIKQYKLLDKEVPDLLLPRSINADGTLKSTKSSSWTSGFFPGSLWYLYQFAKDDSVKRMAIRRTSLVEKEKLNVGDHDIGFKIMCSFGNALRITKDTLKYAPIIITAAKTLVKRFNPVVGAIRSWGSIKDTTQYLVIVDNMMNLELLFTATRLTKDSSFYKIALSHADKTLANHFRTNGSSYHVVNYNQKNGAVLEKKTVQGYSNESAWARGQAWGLYGYTLCYRETRKRSYLDQAHKIAGFLLNHPNLPTDKIPYWDFNAPNIPYALRDASAAAIIASALLELCKYTSGSTKDRYYNNAQSIITKLTQSSYRNPIGAKHNFILNHAVGHFPAKSEVDVPLVYADYYYVESLIRYQQFLTQQQIVSFTLINADTDQPIQTLFNGITLNLADLPSRKLNVRANTNPSNVGSVLFNLTGTQTKKVVENIVPYALFGDKSNADYNAWTPAAGTYTLKGTPFSACDGTGSPGMSLLVNFTVTDQATITKLLEDIDRTAAYPESRIQGLQLKVYPNPASGNKIDVDVQNLGQQRATFLLHDMAGRVVHIKHFIPDGPERRNIRLLFDKQLKPGMYLLRLQTLSGQAQTKVLVK